MKAEFWHNRWKNREIGFHLNEVNPYLIQYFDTLAITRGGRLLVPLCGKTHDIGWLLKQGYSVIGAELSEQAIKELFENLGLNPAIEPSKSGLWYRAQNIDVWVGDIFDLSVADIGRVDAIYDRAALVALPEDMRTRYAGHLVNLTQKAPQLLITFEYDQQKMEGPPFSVGSDRISKLYREHYSSKLLQREPLEGGLRGSVDAQTVVWLLR
ncbi:MULTISPECIES: thiopurine S-methyltransferase [Gammaproteobacteria]|uniref:thiopurine S-methyltransferase n=1 Tax=Gammaproteobacteria TaxID=1236 RepID=UPI000DD00458|nr:MULTISPECIES: thiopurine S-methyltransferase [Gammaproteobacteria]RTE87430.1 thiopurine S-methyltransferase [Aliidiomarina sp. B3213]TCZ92785.1 thiopurine S-methyltransferase [Lysobacter sp. N42]